MMSPNPRTGQEDLMESHFKGLLNNNKFMWQRRVSWARVPQLPHLLRTAGLSGPVSLRTQEAPAESFAFWYLWCLCESR